MLSLFDDPIANHGSNEAPTTTVSCKHFLHPLALQHRPTNMPLVRIDLQKGAADRGKKIGEAVYLQMVATLNVPPNDNFQIIAEHDQNSLIHDPGYLGIARTDGIVIIQITLNEGRSTEMKKAFYAAVAEHLHAELGIRKEDVFINLVEVKKENWSFGNGMAQYA